ncbi:Probable protein phosphatase 2C 34 [Linum grandiflorum]
MVLFPSFFNGLARTVSMKKGKPSEDQKDIGKEAAEELAKDAKRNELILSSSGTVSKSNKFASVFSRRGQKGVNQDCLVVWEEFGCQDDMMLCGVFDGHGPWGHMVSKRVRETLPQSLLCNWQETLKASIDMEMELGDHRHRFEIWKESYLKTYAAVDQQLKHHPKIDTFSSGSTALTIVKQEAERIKNSKGRIFCLPDEPGVYRIWRPSGKTPGLALSRAFGDYCIKDFGLISTPEVTQLRITDNDQFVILATDGVWDVVSNQEAVRVVSSAAVTNREKSAKRLVEFAARAWKRKRNGIAMDDMSAICLFFHRIDDDDSAAAAEPSMIVSASGDQGDADADAVKKNGSE